MNVQFPSINSVEMSTFSRQNTIAPPQLPGASRVAPPLDKKNISQLTVESIQDTRFIEQQIKNFIDSMPDDLLDGWHDELTTEEGEYSGPIVNGKPSGEGTITVPYGTYEGTLNPLPHGKGVLTTPLSVVKGTFVNGTCYGETEASFLEFRELSKKIKEGRIEMTALGTLPLREKFQGLYVEGKCTNGAYWFVDGTYYHGTLNNGKRNGEGLCLFANGDSYEGEWQNDHFFGKGVYTAVNGEQYDGEWAFSQRHGKGVLTSPGGSQAQVTYNEGNLVTE